MELPNGKDAVQRYIIFCDSKIIKNQVQTKFKHKMKPSFGVADAGQKRQEIQMGFEGTKRAID